MDDLNIDEGFLLGLAKKTHFDLILPAVVQLLSR
jgi:hypothetical protein